MVEKVFNALCENKNMSIKDKLAGIKMLLDYTIDRYMADDGLVYGETFDCDLGLKDIQYMSLTEIDKVVDESAFGNDIVFDLQLLSNFAKWNWGAAESTVACGEGFILFSVKYDDENTLKRIIDIADAETSFMFA